ALSRFRPFALSCRESVRSPDPAFGLAGRPSSCIEQSHLEALLMSNATTFARRGIVFTPSDLNGPDWVRLMTEAGLNLVALHGGIEEITAFVESEAGRRFLADAEAAGLEREYELHAMSWLLPRDRFAQHPDWFRMDRH